MCTINPSVYIMESNLPANWNNTGWRCAQLQPSLLCRVCTCDCAKLTLAWFVDVQLNLV